LKVELVELLLGIFLPLLPLPSYLIFSLVATFSILVSYSFLTWFPTKSDSLPTTYRT